MIPWKRTLGWALCAAMAATAVAAEEGEAQAAEAAVAAEAAAEAEGAPAGTAEAEDAGSADWAGSDADVPASGDADLGAGDADVPADLAADEPLAAAPRTTPAPAGASLGVVAYDSRGRQGRIHIVVSGDTLWHISDAYLGTPWVWPSIWRDNGEIANPHVIHPGDRIWITPTEMRRLTAEEADAMLANGPQPLEPLAPAALDTDSLVTESPMMAPAEARSVRVAAREMTGLISPEVYTSAASIVGRVPERVFLSQEDKVYIGLGESEVDVGDEFTLFRSSEKVFDPDSGELLGYHVDLIGWVRVEETYPETSLASIRMSTSEVEEGDKVMPREPLPPEIDVQPTPEGLEGKISFFPRRRVLMGFTDFVYLNRGTIDGLEVGNALEVFRPGYAAAEPSRDELVEVPDRVVATMLVVRAEEDSAVALVTGSDTELKLGDRFRGARQ